MKVVSLFSGAGGFDLGFIQAGYNIVFANDIDKTACMTYQKNIGNITCEDIRNVKSSNIPNDFDVLIGGFPCQGFSINNKKRTIDDRRNFLYLELMRIVRDKRPKHVIIENVKGIITLGNGAILDKIIKDLSNLNYFVSYKIINCMNYGLPQSRERVFIFATSNYKFELQPCNLPIKTVEEAIGYLQDKACQKEPILFNKQLIYNHVARNDIKDMFWARKYKINQDEICTYLKANKKGLSTKKIDTLLGYRHTAGHWFRSDKFGSLPNKEQWIALKKLLKFDNTYDLQMTTYIQKKITFEQSLRISNWARPSRTITASNVEIHPNLKRRLSVREAAILQSFPNDFVFYGSISSMYKQVGNAVPPLISYHIAKQIKECITNTTTKDLKNDLV